MVDAKEVARRARLRISSPKDPGFTRKALSTKLKDSGKKWSYLDLKGSVIKDSKVIDRINGLAIPPAWKDVWICSHKRGSIQATGKDAKGRTQYRYHNDWVAMVSLMKFDRIMIFARNLPAVRRHYRKDLDMAGGHDRKAPGFMMPKQKVIALVIALMDKYHIRVGNDEYARKNASYGLTTLKEGHMKRIKGAAAEGRHDAVFKFMGKSGKEWNIVIEEDDLVDLIVESGRVGGLDKSQDLFRYDSVNEDGSKGKDHDIKSGHINEYLSNAAWGLKVTAKDFRTWYATWKAASLLGPAPEATSQRESKQMAKDAIEEVSKHLGNTPAVCRSSYIHPAVLADHADGSLRDSWATARSKRAVSLLSKDESTALHYLEARFDV